VKDIDFSPYQNSTNEASGTNDPENIELFGRSESPLFEGNDQDVEEVQQDEN
jgi:hypothetical protein